MKNIVAQIMIFTDYAKPAIYTEVWQVTDENKWFVKALNPTLNSEQWIDKEQLDKVQGSKFDNGMYYIFRYGRGTSPYFKRDAIDKYYELMSEVTA